MLENVTAGSGGDMPDRLISDAEFKETILQLLTKASGAGLDVRVVVTSVDGESTVATYPEGFTAPGDATHARTFFDDGQLAVTCRCEAWRTAPQTVRADVDKLLYQISEMVRRHWGERDPATMLPYLKTAGIPTRFAATAREAASRGAAVAVLHTDLDHFKAVNEEFTETGGNAVLREFCDRLREDFGGLGVVVRTGGEEFSALLDHGSLAEMVSAASKFRRRMAAEPFVRIGRPNTCSIGLALYADAEPFADARHPDDVLTDARDAERRAKEEGRNRIAMSGTSAVSAAAPLPVTAADLILAGLAARRRQLLPEDGEAALPSAIREGLLAAFADCTDVATAVADVRDKLSLLLGSFNGGSRPLDLLGVLDSLEWATIVTGALFASAYTKKPVLAPTSKLALQVDGTGQLFVVVDEAVIDLGCRLNTVSPLRAEVGRPFFEWHSAPEGATGRMIVDGPEGCDPLSPVLLLPIGDAAKEVAEDLRHVVASVVDVDDRPTRGGGLPDFWQSNLSRVARACLANPNIGVVVAIGDEGNAKLTLLRLGQLAGREASDLQRSLSMNAEDLAVLTGRAISVVRVPAEREAVLAAVGNAVVELPALDFANRPAVDLLRQSRRRLPIGAPNQYLRLDYTDGLKARTLADVYPEALQLIRGARSAFDHLEPQRGTFREMTGFKVVLTEPLQDRVPDYWQPERQQLDGYYSRSFKDAEGLFGLRFQRTMDSSETSMMEFAVEAVAEAVARKTPTRRINLPLIPDTLDQPLGLSCIQLMPRERDGAAVLDPIFVWRTVDALVGFPFSAYASIRWVEDFLGRVNTGLEGRAGVQRVRCGTLTYLALSFHMYLHDGDVEIARTIVQDASL